MSKNIFYRTSLRVTEIVISVQLQGSHKTTHREITF